MRQKTIWTRKRKNTKRFSCKKGGKNDYFLQAERRRKKALTSENLQENQIKLLLQKNAELEEKIKYLEQKIKFYETKENIKIQKNKPENHILRNPEKLFYNVGDIIEFGNYKWIVTEVSEEKALLLCKKCVKESNFLDIVVKKFRKGSY